MPKNRPNSKTTLSPRLLAARKDRKMINAVEIRIIPHGSQRYNTVGDWWMAPGGALQIRVSEFSQSEGWKLSMCVAIHELTEALLCLARCIPERAVDAFDTGVGADLEEPGDDPRAPYHREHLAASVPERALLSEFGISRTVYDEALERTGHDSR